MVASSGLSGSGAQIHRGRLDQCGASAGFCRRAWAISLALVNILRVLQVKKVLGIFPFGTGEAKALVAAFAAGLVTFAIQQWRDTVNPGTLILANPTSNPTTITMMLVTPVSSLL